ncbi:hypothetical protein QRN89_29650 [Streptomyces chengbuensis]|uniref:hypothetical protein n=1 Tax=Streptomyces chengbuensis TaxID=3053466 RepID=UPI0025B3E4F9|nr:hypothetical protein [Streptomyces sp. HUAS CB01]WJY53603.1 hypothetical protein QRN89_29650 [Streptomyces sp. HUAS CB01]
MTHIGAREYDPTIGQFISVDPLLELDKHQTRLQLRCPKPCDLLRSVRHGTSLRQTRLGRLRHKLKRWSERSALRN